MKKLCCIFNTPTLYRESIYRLIDKTYICDWFFEDTDNKLKVFDAASLLRKVKYLHSIQFGSFYWVKGIISLLYSKEYDRYLMMGHSRNLSILLFVIFKRMFFSKKKVYLWTHGIYGKENRLEYSIKKLLLESADGVFLYGNYSMNLMIQKGFDANKLFTIHNSLNYEEQLKLRKRLKLSNIYIDHFKNTNPVIIFIGRLNAIKRLDMLIEAVSILEQKKVFVNLVFIGDGDEKDRLMKLSTDKGIDQRVWFYGACYDEEKNAKFIYNADLCVAPGNVGLTAMHALMFGCPVVTHDNFAFQMPEYEAIKVDQTGCFFTFNDIVSMTDSIEKWLSNHTTERDEVRKACFQEIDSFWNPQFQINVIKSVFDA